MSTPRQRLILNGAIVFAVGLLFGFPAMLEVGDPGFRAWRAAHLSLILSGLWLLATAGVLPTLVLEARELSALVWSLLANGYGFMTATPIEAVLGFRATQPTGSPLVCVAFLGNVIGVLGALLGALLTIEGARRALKQPASG